MKLYSLLLLLLFPTILFSKEIGFDTESYIAKGVCPFECCTYRDWYSKNEVTLYERPSLRSKIIGKIPKDKKVIAVTGEVHLNPSKFVFNKDYWGGYKAKDVIWILNNLGEGEYQAWDGNKIVGVIFFDDNTVYSQSVCSKKWSPINCSGELKEPLSSTWWVNVKLENGLSGWTNKSEYFSNIDACG